MAEKPTPNPEEKGKEGDEDKPQTPEVPKQGTEGGDKPPISKNPPEGTPPTPSVDYKQKFSDSANRNQHLEKEVIPNLEQKVSDLEEKLTNSQQTLSEKELKEKYPNWEFMDEEEKRKAKEDFEKEKRLKTLEAKEKWRDDYARLPEGTKERIKKKGGEQAFKDFACSPENRGQKNLENLAKQFLYEESKPAPEPPKKPENKAGLEATTGGPKTAVVPKKGFTATEAAELRKRDPQRYNKLAAQGRLKIIDEKK